MTEKQLAIRRTGITATDVRVLVGMDPHGRTAHDVWTSKVLGVDDFKSTEATELGEEFEPIVIRRLAMKRGLRVVPRAPDDMTIWHPERPTHIATPDAFFDQPSIGQVKVVGLHNAHLWGRDDDANKIPDYVLIQVAWEMYVAGMDVEHVGALTGTEVRPYTIVRSEDGIDDLIGTLVEEADRFMVDHVIPKRPPEVDGSAGSKRMLSAIWPRHREGAFMRADATVEGLARSYFEASVRRDAALQDVELAAQLLKTATGDLEGIDGDGWRLLLKWRGPTTYTVDKAGYRHLDIRKKGTKKGAKAA